MAGKLLNLADMANLLHFVVPMRFLCHLARFHGRISCLARRQARRNVSHNLLALLGAARGAEAVAATRAFFEYHYVRNLLLALAPRLKAGELNSLVAFEGLEHLDSALLEGKGVILLSSHLNSVATFLAVILLRQRGYDLRVAVPSSKDPWEPTALGRLLNRLDGAKGIGELMGAFYCQFNVRPIVRCLSENSIVAQTGDGWHSAAFVEVPFLGRSLPFPTGVMSIAQRTGAPVVPLFVTGAPPDKMRFVLEKPIAVESQEDANGVLQAQVAFYANRLEHHVLENVPCWQYWLVENALETMAAWPRQALGKRYAV